MTIVWVRARAALRGALDAPPSKSYAHRAAIAAAVAGGRTVLRGMGDADDIRVTRAGLRALGAGVHPHRGEWVVRAAPEWARRPATVNCRSSGTSLRFLTSLAALGTAPIRFCGATDLARRPIRPLLEALAEHGADVDGPAARAGLPFTLRGPIRPGTYRVEGSRSSQFASSLLLALSGAKGPSRVRVVPPVVSRPYLDATRAVLRTFGVRVTRRGRTWHVRPPVRKLRRQFTVPGDASSAAYLWAAGAITGGAVTVRGVRRRWPQADRAILTILRSMGARVVERGSTATVAGPLRRGVRWDFTDTPDLFPLVAVLAACAPRATSRLTGGPQLAWKESDRRRSTRALLRPLSSRLRAVASGWEVRSGRLPPRARWRRLTDHRLVMSAGVAACALPNGGRIDGGEAVAKSFPGFWTALARLGAEVRSRP